MNSSPAVDVPIELVRRYHALQAARAARRAGRCDCQCRTCTSRATARTAPPPASTSTAT